MTSLINVILSPSALSGPQGLAPRRGRILTPVTHWFAGLKTDPQPVGAVYTDVPKKGLEATGQNQNPLKQDEVECQLILGRVRLPTPRAAPRPHRGRGSW